VCRGIVQVLVRMNSQGSEAREAVEQVRAELRYGVVGKVAADRKGVVSCIYCEHTSH